LQISVFLALLVVTTCEVSTSRIIASKGYIAKLCQDNCQQSTEKTLVDHCERGCRFFDLAQTSDLLDLNTANLSSVCVDSCKEAYLNTETEDVCVLGCNSAKEVITSLEKKANELLEQTQSQMRLFNLFFSKKFSSFWSSDSSEESDDLFDDSDNHFLNLPSFSLNTDGISRPNRLENNANNDVEILTLTGDELASIDSAGNTLCATRVWLHRLSFILIVMGALSLALVSSFYIAAVIKHKKMKDIQRATGGDMSKPPSYETLINDGFIVLSNDTMETLKEKDEKLFIA